MEIMKEFYLYTAIGFLGGILLSAILTINIKDLYKSQSKK